MDNRILAGILAAILIGISITLSVMIYNGQSSDSDSQTAYSRTEKTKEADKTKAPKTTQEASATKKTESTKTPAKTQKADETKAPEKTKEAKDTKAPEKTEEASQKPDETKAPAPEKAVCKNAVPESEAVDNDYFKDALFIGDSRVEGFRLLSGIKNTTFYAYKGLNVKQVQTEKFVKQGDTKVTVMEALGSNQFNKVYIKLGVNELGWGSYPTYIKRYKELIKRIKETQPEGVKIYVMEVIQVTKEKNDGNDIFTQANVNKMNKMLAEMVEEEGVYYLSINDVLTDDEGFLFADAANDGIHLQASYCKKWLEYIKTHVAQ